MLKAVNIADGFARFDDLFSPKIVGELNGQHVKLVRVEGDKAPRHTHEDEDELFGVLEGELEVMTHDTSVTLRPGEFTVVPAAWSTASCHGGTSNWCYLSLTASPTRATSRQRSRWKATTA